jgi:hypothetical protein
MSIAVKNPLSLGDSAIVISPDVIATVRIEELTMNGEPVAHAYGAMGHEVIARIDKDLPVSAWQYGLLVKGGKGR